MNPFMIILVITLAAIVYVGESKAGGLECDPIVKTVYQKQVHVEYVPIEIKVEPKYKLNRVKLHLGVAPLRSLDFSHVQSNSTAISNLQGPVGGISYDRVIFTRQGISLGVIILTNGSVLGSVGLEF